MNRTDKSISQTPPSRGFFLSKSQDHNNQPNTTVNILRTAVQANVEEKDVYNVFWMAGLERKGLLKVKTKPFLAGRFVAAELAGIKWLLETANVCGHDKTGAGLQLFFSSAETLDLVEKRSVASHLAPYANFLHTRFYGCEVDLDSDKWWVSDGCEKEVAEISAEPTLTSLHIPCLGEVELTAHAVEMYVLRFDRKPTRAWRELLKHAQTAKEIHFVDRHPVFDVQHKNPGKHYATKGGHIFVVTPANQDWPKPRLVTVTKPSSLAVRYTT